MNYSFVGDRVYVSACLFWVLVGHTIATRAASVTIKATADTTLQEVFPENNFGGFTHVAAGATGVARTTGAGFGVTRGLFKFDLTGQIPAGAKINSASLTLKVTFTPGSARNSTFELRRVLQAWGEGDKQNVGGVNTGQPATANEATWLMRSAPATAWSKPGGAAPADFSSTISATVAVAGVGTYAFGPSPSLSADVQAWVDNPNANFGWILISQGEAISQTARRWGSREDGANAPTLTIDYTVPPTELRITSIVRQGGNVILTWTGGAAPYRLQRQNRVGDATWTNVGNASNGTTATVPIDSAQAVYRITSG